MNVTEFLKNRSVEFETIPHREIYDAQRMAEAIHVSGRKVAKTVLLRTGSDDHVIAVLPANRAIDFDKVAQVLGDGKVELATEFEIAQLFPDCEIGAIPPFGSQYGLSTIVEKSLAADTQIVFEGNTHHEAFRIGFPDFCRIEEALVVDFAEE